MTLSITHFAMGYDSPIPYPDFFSKGTPICAQIDLELYFPDGHESRSPASQAVKALCYECPYRAECLEWAVVNREDGIWGGTNNAERTAMRNGKRSRVDTIKRGSY